MGIEMPLPEILQGKYPAKAHARKVAKYLQEKGGEGHGVIYLEGTKEKLMEVCDT